jgi:hypothetical protein
LVGQDALAIEMHAALLGDRMDQNESEKNRQIREIRLQALRADVEASLGRLPFLDNFSALILQQSESPRLWVDLFHYVEMAPDQSTYRFVEEAGNMARIRYKTERWDDIVAHVTAHVAKLMEARQVLSVMASATQQTAPVISPVPRHKRRWPAFIYTWMLGIICGVLVMRLWPVFR